MSTKRKAGVIVSIISLLMTLITAGAMAADQSEVPRELATVSPALAADTEIIDVRGTGGQASFTFYTEVDGKITTDIYGEDGKSCVETVTTTVSVQVTEGSEHLRPGGPSSSRSLGVDVKETVEVPGCDTGYEPFSGRGAASEFHFTTNSDLGGGHLKVLSLVVTSEDGNEVRVLDLDVIWSGNGTEAATETVRQNGHDRSGTGHVVNEKHAGTVSLLSATATATLDGIALGEAFVGADKDSDDSPSLWDTASRRITTKDQPSNVSKTASVATSESTFTTASVTTASTCTGGTWSGYWTWTGTNWFWTWVYYPCNGGWAVS